MITTVTLNASVDKAYLVGSYAPGTVNRVPECLSTAGGKGLNVAKTAKLAGLEVTATGFIGGHNGAFVEESLAKKGIACDFVRIAGETRCCINVVESETGRQTEFLEPGPTVSPQELEQLYEKFRILAANSDVVTISGSLPRGCDERVYPRLIAAAKAMGKPVILDTSGKLLKTGVDACPTMIKPNREELAALTGQKAANLAELIESMAGLQSRGIAYLAVSLGREGALMACDAGIYRGFTPDLPVKNTVGCGDAMVAAFAAGFARGYGPEELLLYAVAVSTANALTAETGCFAPAALPALLAQCRVQKLQK